jgi:hypothetical protein
MGFVLYHDSTGAASGQKERKKGWGSAANGFLLSNNCMNMKLKEWVPLAMRNTTAISLATI